MHVYLDVAVGEKVSRHLRSEAGRGEIGYISWNRDDSREQPRKTLPSTVWTVLGAPSDKGHFVMSTNAITCTRQRLQTKSNGLAKSILRCRRSFPAPHFTPHIFSRICLPRSYNPSEM